MTEDIQRIEFARPDWVPTWLLIQAARVGLVMGATLLSIPPSPGRTTFLPQLLAAEFVIACIAMFGAQVRLRRRGGLPPILLGAENITVPRHALSLRSIAVPYVDVRSVSLRGQGRAAQIVIDTKRRAWRFPQRSFASPDALARLRLGLRQHILALPQGAALWPAIDARHALADRLALSRPWGSWAAVGLILVCFVAQAAFLRQEDGFGLIDAGANAGFLVRDGQWFRLVTASLLHLNARHVLGNALFLGVIGAIIEPLIGLRQFLLVLLSTCVFSQIVSAEFALHLGSYVSSVGISGGLYGLIGALAAITWRFGAHLPGGFRLPIRVWVLIGISVLVTPFLATQVDNAAHAGGFASGLLIGGLLLRRRIDLAAASAPRWLTHIALAACVCIWIGGIGAAALHARSQSARAADRYTLARDMLAAGRFAPASRNFVAWAVAKDPSAPVQALENARLLARFGVMQESHARRPNLAVKAAIIDTEAVLTHRLGEEDAAIRLDLPQLIDGPEPATHVAMFAEAAWRRGGIAMRGDAGPPPVLAIGAGVLRLTETVPVVRQTDVLALLHRDHAVVGVLRFQLIPGFSGTQVLPLPSSEGAPSLSAPASIWTDGRSHIDIARMDAGGCDCEWPSLVPGYYPIKTSLETLP